MPTPPKKLTLKDWIEKEGSDKVAKFLRCDRSAVNHWRRGHCLPSSSQMAAIVKVTKGSIDFNAEIVAFHKKSA